MHAINKEILICCEILSNKAILVGGERLANFYNRCFQVRAVPCGSRPFFILPKKHTEISNIPICYKLTRFTLQTCYSKCPVSRQKQRKLRTD